MNHYITKLLQEKTIENLLHIAESASEKIMSFYLSDELITHIKADHSPVTEADIAAHTIIEEGLKTHFNLPVLSEESFDHYQNPRKQWPSYWLVDPLDGTKEFANQSDEFTINIALVHQHKAVLGLIFVPVTKTAYWAIQGHGAFKKSSEVKKISCASMTENFKQNATLKVLSSKRHDHPKLKQLLAFLKERFSLELSTGGSALKFCRIAEGRVHLYPRFGPTSEWDTAAAQIIIEEAGGSLISRSLEPFYYNNRETVLNKAFYCLADYDNNKSKWKALLSEFSSLNETTV